MPREGDTTLARFALAIAREVGFSLGPPRLSDDGSRVTVPLLRTAPRPRRYVVAGEAVDALSAVDVGRIDRIRVRNESSALLFLPPGSLFEGRGTASRGTTSGVLLEPSASRDIEVKCVQASEPICAGATLALARGLVPEDVAQALISRDQGLVWSTVGPSVPEASQPGPSGPAAELNRDPKECGEALLDSQGVVAAEVYDHPDSWRAAGRRTLDVEASPSSLGVRETNAPFVVREFFEGLASRGRSSGPDDGRRPADSSLAFTAVGGDIVHLLAFGRDLTRTTPGEATNPMGAVVDTGAEPGPLALAPAGDAAADADVESVPQPSPAELEEPAPLLHHVRPRRKKVLTSGWDGSTFASLEHFTRKEFQGDRSAAIRALVRNGLQERGYMGPRAVPTSYAQPSEDVPPSFAPIPPSAEAKILDYERIAATESFADWLRKRARSELEKIAASGDDASRESARAALDRLPPPPSEVPVLEPEEIPVEERAPEALEPAPAVPSVDVRPLLRRAFAASAGGRYPEALTLFDEALTAEPENRTARLGRAVALRRSGKTQEALDALDAVLSAEPTNAAALLNRGRLLQERGDLEAALDTFDQLARVAPNDWDVWLVRGDVLAKLGRRPEALKAYSEALRRNPEDEALQLRIRTLEAAETAPAPPPLPKIPLPPNVQEGQSYLVLEGHRNLSFRVLRALAARGVPSLVITSQTADAARHDVGLAGVRVLELSHAPGEGHQDPTALAALTQLVGHFVLEGRGHAVIALDGLPSLVLENGPRETILFIERVHEIILQSHAVFLIYVPPDCVSDRELALLERSLRTLS